MTGNFWKTMFVKGKKTRRHDFDLDVKIIFRYSSILYFTLIFYAVLVLNMNYFRIVYNSQMSAEDNISVVYRLILDQKYFVCHTNYNLFILFYLFIFMYFTNLQLIRLISSSTNKRNARHITKRCKYAQYVIIDPINGSENVGNQVNERERRNWLTMHRYAE